MTEALILDAATLATLSEKLHACVTLPGDPVPFTSPNPWAAAFRALKPGAYVVAVVERGQAMAHMITLRLAGFSIRDVVEIMHYDRAAGVIARKPLAGTVAANIAEHRTGGINIDGTRIGTEARVNGGMTSIGVMHDDAWKPAAGVSSSVIGRWPANVVFDDGAAKMLDEQTGETRSSAAPRNVAERSATHAKGAEKAHTTTGYEDAGGASRFFYRSDLPALLRYLVRLVTPPGGVVLDPFWRGAGLDHAAAAEGFAFVGVSS